MLESALLRTLASRKYMNKSVYTAVTSSPPLDPKALADFQASLRDQYETVQCLASESLTIVA